MRHISFTEEDMLSIRPLDKLLVRSLKEKYEIDYLDTFRISGMAGEWDNEIGLVHDPNHLILFMISHDGGNVYIADGEAEEFQERLQYLRELLEKEYADYIPDDTRQALLGKLNSFVECNGAIIKMSHC